jgi:FAD/FMN-containing dehydrogenase
VHLNVLPPNDWTGQQRLDAIYKSKTVLNEVVDRFAGSISAEHGIGRLKRADFEKRLPDSRRNLLGAIKRALDPDLLLNPGCQLSFAQDS